ncbi:MAG: YggS family pyridoxal phosphate-dependent enzyme [Nitrospirae bacterium]|nr:YggS family pyridoxal phosphate-dependent enzyme [Nitrospirota bacterium]
MIKHTLLENIKKTYRRMSDSAIRAERNPADIKLIAVTKIVSIEMIREAIDAGLRRFGENRIQEAQKKVTSDELRVTNNRIEWHLVGHLQSNKARLAVELFDLIHSVDSIELAVLLNKQAEKLNKIQKILVQVKLSDEQSKSGISKDNLLDTLSSIQGLNHLDIQGLMTIPPFFDDSEMARPYFKELCALRDRINELRVTGYELRELSMGMSNDFEVAIEEGATMVRIGAAIFGERAIKKEVK